MRQETVELANETQQSTVQGTSFTAYGLQPALFTKEVVDAAQKQLYFANFVKVIYAPTGTKDVVIPKRSYYLGSSGVTIDTSEATTSDISNTSLSNLDSVTATPEVKLARFTVTNHAIRTNVVNLVEAAREELSYAIGDNLDQHIATTIGDATEATSSATGAIVIYGGDAYTDATLSAGDVITTDLVAKAKRLLQDKFVWYWNGSTFTKVSQSTAVKNPWQNTPDDPFVLFIGPAQEETFLKDSQFVNAAEYGNNIVVQNGEIGSYLGIRIVVTTNVESVASGSSGPDGDGNAGTDMTRCILCKPKKACALVWGKEPEITVASIPERAQQTIVLEAAYQAKVIHDDAIVFIDVADA